MKARKREFTDIDRVMLALKTPAVKWLEGLQRYKCEQCGKMSILKGICLECEKENLEKQDL